MVVLLDNDKAGDSARADLAVGGAYGAKLIDESLVLQLGQGSLTSLMSSNPLGVVGIEDLIPIDVALSAAALYCREFVPAIDVPSLQIDGATIFPAGDETASVEPKNEGTLKYLQKRLAELSGMPDFHLDKVAFARATIDVLTSNPAVRPPSAADVELAAHNFKILLAEVSLRQRQAERAESVEKISSRINRAKRDFTRTHHDQARKEDVADLIEEISNQLDNSPESEEVRASMRGWRHQFHLDADPRSLVEDFPGLLRAIESLAYQSLRQGSERGSLHA